MYRVENNSCRPKEKIIFYNYLFIKCTLHEFLLLLPFLKCFRKVFNWNTLKDILQQSLESEVLKSLIKIYEDKRIIGHVQNGNVSIINLIRESNENIIIFFDSNYIKGKFQRILEKFNLKCNNCFSSIKINLLNYFKALLYNKVLNLSQKKFQWKNVINHLIGEHGYYFHSILNVANSPYRKEIIYIEEEDSNSDLDLEFDQLEAPPSEVDILGLVINKTEYPNIIYYLTKFLDYTEKLFDYVSPQSSTQKTQSLNSLKTKFTNKNTNWTSSLKLRIPLSILHKNKP